VPLRDGRRYAPLSLNLLDAGLTRDSSLYRNLATAPAAGRGGGAAGAGGAAAGGAGGLVRNSSEGALLSPTAPGALARQQALQQQMARQRSGGGEQQRSGSVEQQQRDMWLEVEEQTREPAPSSGGAATHPSSSPTKRASAAAAAAAPTGNCTLGLTTDCVLELGVRNCSERYFRTWLSRLPGKPGAEGAESAVVVLEPGDNVRLLCPLLPTAAAGSSAAAAVAAAGHGGSSGSRLASSGGSGSFHPSIHAHGQQQPSVPHKPAAIDAHDVPVRIQCAERLVETMGVRWEMITGAFGWIRFVGWAVSHNNSDVVMTC
jgi:hypothetical protein